MEPNVVFVLICAFSDARWHGSNNEFSAAAPSGKRRSALCILVPNLFLSVGLNSHPESFLTICITNRIKRQSLPEQKRSTNCGTMYNGWFLA